jgi:hypothetical protein
MVHRLLHPTELSQPEARIMSAWIILSLLAVYVVSKGAARARKVTPVPVPVEVISRRLRYTRRHG